MEKGRYKGIPFEKRICDHCSSGQVEDELHFLFECSKFDNIRLSFITQINKMCPNFKTLQKKDKFVWILSNEDEKLCSLLAETVFKFNMCRLDRLDQTISL